MNDSITKIKLVLCWCVFWTLWCLFFFVDDLVHQRYVWAVFMVACTAINLYIGNEWLVKWNNRNKNQ